MRKLDLLCTNILEIMEGILNPPPCPTPFGLMWLLKLIGRSMMFLNGKLVRPWNINSIGFPSYIHFERLYNRCVIVATP